MLESITNWLSTDNESKKASHQDANWETYKLEDLKTAKSCEVAARQCLLSSLSQRAYAVLSALGSAASAIAVLYGAMYAAKGAALLASILLFPLMIIPPIYALLIFTASAVAFVATVYLAGKPTTYHLAQRAEEQWNRADDLLGQRAIALIKAATL